MGHGSHNPTPKTSSAQFQKNGLARDAASRAKSIPSARCALGRERAAAAAVARCVGVLEHKALAHQRFLVFQGRAAQIQQALRINKKPRAKFLENLVPVARLGIQPHRVRQSRAAATLHAHAKPPTCGDTPSFSSSAIIFFAAFSVRWIAGPAFSFSAVCVVISAVIFRISKNNSGAISGQHPPTVAIPRRKTPLRPRCLAISATTFRARELQYRAFSSNRRWPP